MDKLCRAQGGPRDWTKEEMMVYLDWSKAEEDRVEALVAAEMKDNPVSEGEVCTRSGRQRRRIVRHRRLGTRATNSCNHTRILTFFPCRF